MISMTRMLPGRFMNMSDFYAAREAQWQRAKNWEASASTTIGAKKTAGTKRAGMSLAEAQARLQRLTKGK